MMGVPLAAERIWPLVPGAWWNQVTGPATVLYARLSLLR